MDTLLHSSLEAFRVGLAKKQSDLYLAKRNGDPVKMKAATAALTDSGVTYWSPHDSDDGATGRYRTEMQEALDLTGWPYRDPA